MILGIYGCGGLGKEVLVLADEINKLNNKWSQIVFIVDNEFINGNEVKYIKNTKIVSIDEIFYNASNFEVVIAIGEPFVRNIKYSMLKERGIQFTTLVHPSVNITPCTVIKEGSIICSGSFISCDVTIGNNVVVMPRANIGHDCIIGDHCVICSFASFGGHIEVGENTFIGMSTSIMQDLKIGKNAVASMGSCVMREIPDDTIVAGNPARVMSKNDSHLIFKK